MKKDNDWDEYWKTEGKKGEVFLRADGGKPEYLSKLWKNYFNNFSKNISIVDIACGGGSVFLELPVPNNYKLYGTDISNEALSTAKARINGLNALECSSTNIPLDDNQIDNVVSQFGIEYAGITAFEEAIRILKGGGNFYFLTHYENGYIDKKNRGKLVGAKLIKESNFLQIAENLTNALYGGNKELIETLHDSFSTIEPKVLKYKTEFPEGIHADLYNGFRKLISNMQNYACNDITNWLQSMNKEVEKTIIRLEKMKSATLSELEIKKLSITLKNNGLKKFNYEKFSVPEYSSPIGWLISGTK